MKNKTVIITGASRGIGRALSIKFASMGHRVIAVARNERLLKSLQALYPHLIEIIDGDMTQDQDRQKIKNSITEKGIFLIHNAGVAIPSPLRVMDNSILDLHYELHVKAPLRLTQLLLPHLEDGGRVLHISSGLAHHPLPGMAAYGITKSALLMLKEYFNAEFQAQNVVFGSVMPGIIETDIQKNLRLANKNQLPSLNIFQGFFNRSELLPPQIAAKFIAWLMLTQENESFSKGDWNIYDTWHHQFWAESGEVIQREKTDQELKSAGQNLVAKL